MHDQRDNTCVGLILQARAIINAEGTSDKALAKIRNLQELLRFYRRTNDGGREGYATVEQTGEVLVAPGHGMAMADHAIDATEVVGNVPAIGLALYGYALARFPAVVWFLPDFDSVRVGVSRRAEAACCPSRS